MIRVLRIQSRVCVGGPALNTILLCAGLAESDYQSLLVGGRLEKGEKSMEPFAVEKGVAFHELPEMGRTLRWREDFRALRSLIRLIRLYRPQIVHTHTAKAGALGRIAAFLCGVPVRVHTFHGHVFHGYFSPLKNRVVIWVERFLALLSHRIIAISPSQHHDLTLLYKIVPADKCQIIRLGFELDQLGKGEPGKLRRELGLDRRTRLAAILARLVPIKNHQLLLHALAKWKQRQGELHDFKLLIVGDGEQRQQLEALSSQLGIADLVVFLGWRSDVADIYADIDLNVLVSKNEGTPVTLIEGLSCGIPILTTDVGGIRDVAGDECGKILSAEIDPQGLSEALEAAITGPHALRHLNRSQRERFHATFNSRRLVAEMKALYETLLPSEESNKPQIR